MVVVGTADNLKEPRQSAALFMSPHYRQPLYDFAHDDGRLAVYKSTDIDETGKYFYLKAGAEEGYKNWIQPMEHLIDRQQNSW